MKKVVLFITVLVGSLILSVNALACTSFAVYSQKTYYGMNFDHYIHDMRFSIVNDTKSNIKVFSMDFLINGKYYPTVSMSNKGLFSSCQLAYPQKGTAQKENQDQMDMFDLFYQAPYLTDQVKDIRKTVTDKTLICQNNFVHNLFADNNGDAVVIETDNKEKWITDIEGKSIVMTNFFNSELKGGNIDSVTGFGADRYKKAKDYIDAHIDAFTYDDGMKALQNAVQISGPFPTQCSMLFDPEAAEVYIVMNKDFTKAWKVSINERMVETYKGFKGHQAVEIGESGLLSEELNNIGVYSGQTDASVTTAKSEGADTEVSDLSGSHRENSSSGNIHKENSNSIISTKVGVTIVSCVIIILIGFAAFVIHKRKSKKSV